MFDHDLGGYSDLVKQLRNGSSKLRMAETHRLFVVASSVMNAANPRESLVLGQMHPDGEALPYETFVSF